MFEGEAVLIVEGESGSLKFSGIGVSVAACVGTGGMTVVGALATGFIGVGIDGVEVPAAASVGIELEAVIRDEPSTVCGEVLELGNGSR